MTQDIVDRLRRVSLDLGVPSRTIINSDAIREAANTIEALSARLHKVGADVFDIIGASSFAIRHNVFSDPYKPNPVRCFTHLASSISMPHPSIDCAACKCYLRQ